MRRAAVAGPLALSIAVWAGAGDPERRPAAERGLTPTMSSVQVLGVRFSSRPDSTRVAVDLEGDVRYTVGRLSNPERLYMDLFQTTISSQLKNHRIAVGDGLLDRVRIGNNQESVTRLVLDLRSAVRYRISELTSPSQLLVELSQREESKSLPSSWQAGFPRGGSARKQTSSEVSSGAVSGQPQENSSSSPNERRNRAATGSAPALYGGGEKTRLSYAGSASPRNVLLIDLSFESNYDDNI
ncbi:MAG TPA: AMIN domain-containing protein, partial [Candidatus Acidoferrales bacterium]|nr:AMIN domain-containing protein [Candidatus Acidoferrales bacterium]